MTIRLITLTFLIILLALLPLSVYSYKGMEPIDFLQHRAWTVEEGLPMNSVNAIAQTPDGYLWLGTEAGLVRFDGIHFKVFNHENTQAMTNNIIIWLEVDRNGTLWMACRDGGAVRYRHGVFDAITEETGLVSNDVYVIIESTDGSIWIGSRKGLNRYINGRITMIPLPECVEKPTITALLEDRNGQIWVGTKGSGLVLVKRSGQTYEAEAHGFNGSWITCLFMDRKGVIWCGTTENGLLKFTGNSYTSLTVENGLTTNYVLSVWEDRFNNMWIGTQGGGINIFNPESGNVSPFDSHEQLAGTTIFSFFEDREGTLWIGTGGGGLNSLRETRIRTYSVKNGLSYHNIFGIFQDNLGRIWSGTKGYGLNILENNRIITLDKAHGLSTNSVVSIAQDHQGNLWFGTLGGGIHRYRKGKFDVFTTSQGLSSNSTRSVYVDPSGTIWAGMADGGIFRFENGHFLKKANVKTRVNMLFRDSKNNLWAATFGNGLCHIGQGKIAFFNTHNGLTNNIVSSIHEDKAGYLWLGTVRGLNRFDGNHFEQLTMKDGLPDDVIYCVLEDNKEDLWVSSNRGIYRIRRQEVEDFFKGKIDRLSPTLYGKESGMLSTECNGANQPSAWKSQDGRLWFPTTNGISVIDPQNVGINNKPPPVVIEKVVMQNESIPIKNQKSIAVIGKTIDIHFTAPSFIVPENIRFKYRLEHIDSDWKNTGETRVAHYENLHHGTFLFKVIACNSDGVWNHTGATLELKLKSKFYQTFIFKFGALALMISLGLLGFFQIRRFIELKRARARASRSADIDPEEVEETIKKLNYLLDVEKVFKDPDLKIKSLACKLVIASRQLSNIINDKLNTNFYELINHHRIKEAQRLLTTGNDDQKSILDISLEVGYNSKSAFNRAFKNFTGLTPSQYRKKHKKCI